jgi:hypothetical protein
MLERFVPSSAVVALEYELISLDRSTARFPDSGRSVSDYRHDLRR